MNRRAMLNPAVTATGALASSSLASSFDAPRAEPPPEFALLRFRRQAMATVFEVALPFGVANASAAAEAALDLVDRLEAQLSVYRGDSEVSRVNQRAFAEDQEVESRFFELLERCGEWTRATAGAFDCACGALIEAWGFFRGPPRVPSIDARQAARRTSGMRFVALDRERRAIRLRREGVKLNLGAVGKGYALDRAAELLRAEFGVVSALLSCGGSSLLALGAPPGEPRGWPIALTDPLDPGRRQGVLFLDDEALGVSSGAFRHFEHAGKKLSHLLDPRTGWPGEQRAGAACVASSAAAADALATAFFLMTDSELHRFFAAGADVAAILLGAADPRAVGRPIRFEKTQPSG